MGKQFWRFVKNEAGDSELFLEGVIAQESWFDDEVTPKQFREQLDSHPGNITVRINSPGGDAFAGVQIYNMLKDRKDTVTMLVDGLAASAASVVAMAGDKIVMNTGSMMMIHKASTMAWGNEEEMQEVIEMLKKVDDNLISIYIARTGKSEAEVKELLAGQGTWMTAEEAVELGFADEAKEGKSSLSESIQNVLGFTKDVQTAAMQPVLNLQTRLKDESENKLAEEAKVKAEADEADKLKKESEMTEAELKAKADEDAKLAAEAEAKMQKQIETAVEGIVAKALPAQPKTTKKVNETEVRINFVNQMAALMNKNGSDLKKFASEGAAFRGVENAIADGENLWVDEVVRNDILKAYNQVGRVGGLVDRESITADTLKILVETAGTGFQPVALGAVKPTDTPVWTPVTFEPFEWAVIVPWKDGDQKRTSINIYNQIVQYIATEYAKLEDKIILTYAGGTVGPETRPASGLVPILTTANRDIQVPDYSSAEVVTALAEAYGQTESDGTITLVANRKTWAQLATSLDGFDRPLFTVVGDQVSAGALGSFRVVMSSVLSDGDVVIGNFADYLLVTRGGLGTLFSREAYIADVINLFTQDASALRADIDITGGVKRVNSFSLLQFGSSS